MKKGVVLLITIAFISVISILILKNLDSTDKFIEKQNYIAANTQVLISIQNTRDEVAKILVKNKTQVDEFLDSSVLDRSIPMHINIDDLNLNFNFHRYEKVDINILSNDDKTKMVDLFSDNNIYNFNLFLEIYNEKLQNSNSKIENTNQLYDIINTFIIRNGNSEINRITDEIGFISGNELYKLNIQAEYLNAKANAYYILDNSGGVKYFDISFK